MALNKNNYKLSVSHILALAVIAFASLFSSNFGRAYDVVPSRIYCSNGSFSPVLMNACTPGSHTIIYCQDSSDNLCRLSSGSVSCSPDCSSVIGTTLEKKFGTIGTECKLSYYGKYASIEACQAAAAAPPPPPPPPPPSITPSPSVTPPPPPAAAECKKQPSTRRGVVSPPELRADEEIVTIDKIFTCHNENIKTAACLSLQFLRQGSPEKPCIAGVESIECGVYKGAAYKSGSNLLCATLKKKELPVVDKGGKSENKDGGTGTGSGDTKPTVSEKKSETIEDKTDKTESKMKDNGTGENIAHTELFLKDVEGRMKSKKIEQAILEVAKLMEGKTYGFRSEFKPGKKMVMSFALSMALALHGDDCGTRISIAACKNKALSLGLIDKMAVKKQRITLGELYELFLKAASVPLMPESEITKKNLCSDVVLSDEAAQVVATARKYDIAIIFNGNKCKTDSTASRATAASFASKILHIKNK